MLKVQVEIKDERKGTFQVLLDGEPWKEIYRAVFGRRPKLPKYPASLKEFEEAFQKIEYQQAKNYAYRRLSSRSYFSQQLHQALTQRGVSDVTADQVIAECIRLGFVDDNAWVKSQVEQLHRRGWGQRAIQQKLRSKGVSADLIGSLISQDDEQERAQIEQWLRKKKLHDKPLSIKEKQSIWGKLQRRGFSSESIRRCINIYGSD